MSDLRCMSCGDRKIPIVYNGKSAEEWYSLYCQAQAELNQLKKKGQERCCGQMKKPRYLLYCISLVLIFLLPSPYHAGALIAAIVFGAAEL